MDATWISDSDRALAVINIQKATQYYNVRLTATSWADLGARQ